MTNRLAIRFALAIASWLCTPTAYALSLSVPICEEGYTWSLEANTCVAKALVAPPVTEPQPSPATDDAAPEAAGCSLVGGDRIAERGGLAVSLIALFLLAGVLFRRGIRVTWPWLIGSGGLGRRRHALGAMGLLAAALIGFSAPAQAEDLACHFDSDRDGTVDCRDADMDADTIANGEDVCPLNTLRDMTPEGRRWHKADDCLDNCPGIFNIDQADRDHDAVGDVCDTNPDSYNPRYYLFVPRETPITTYSPQADPVLDFIAGDDGAQPVPIPNPWHCIENDGDGDDVIDYSCDGNQVDNCPLVANADQADADDNGIGDACDAAAVPPPAVVQPEPRPVPAPADVARDPAGGPCAADEIYDPLTNTCYADVDSDGDGIIDGVDACPDVADPMNVCLRTTPKSTPDPSNNAPLAPSFDGGGGCSLVQDAQLPGGIYGLLMILVGTLALAISRQFRA